VHVLVLSDTLDIVPIRNLKVPKLKLTSDVTASQTSRKFLVHTAGSYRYSLASCETPELTLHKQNHSAGRSVSLSPERLLNGHHTGTRLHLRMAHWHTVGSDDLYPLTPGHHEADNRNGPGRV
jgi:hypothetical protein